MDDTPDGGGPAQPAPAKSRRDRGIFERPKGSGIWWVRYHDQYGREHREKIGTAKSLALEVYQERKTDIRRGKYRADKPRDVLLRDFLPTFLKGRVKRNPGTGALENVLKDMQHAARTAALGKLSLRQIKPGDIRRQVHRRQEAGIAPATINRELAFLRRAFNVAIEDHHADKNGPLGSAARALVKENNQRVRWLSDDEEAALRAALGERQWPKVAVALHTGFRRTNCFRLRWAEDVNFEAGTLRAHQPKGGTDYHVPMNDELRELLRALPSRLARPGCSRARSGRRRSTRRTSSTASSGRRSGGRGSATSRGTTSATPSPRGSRWRESISIRSRSYGAPVARDDAPLRAPVAGAQTGRRPAARTRTNRHQIGTEPREPAPLPAPALERAPTRRGRTP